MNITPYFDKLEYISATADQLKKDLNLFDIEIKFSGDEKNAYNELLYQLTPHIALLAEKNYKKLLDVLYRIDVNEKKIADCVNNSLGLSLPEAISDLIIRRELQKIVIRKHYKPEQNDIYDDY